MSDLCTYIYLIFCFRSLSRQASQDSEAPKGNAHFHSLFNQGGISWYEHRILIILCSSIKTVKFFTPSPLIYSFSQTLMWIQYFPLCLFCKYSFFEARVWSKENESQSKDLVNQIWKCNFCYFNKKGALPVSYWLDLK